VRERDALAAHLAQRGIATAVHYPRPIHLQPALAFLGGKPGDLPVSESLSRDVLCLPLYPELPLSTVAEIAAAVRVCCGP
jgi:dTDP-4-amino-4,6-dideoxygalactose transaminase